MIDKCAFPAPARGTSAHPAWPFCVPCAACAGLHAFIYFCVGRVLLRHSQIMFKMRSKKRARDDGASAQRQQRQSVAGEFFRLLFIPPQQPYPPVNSELLEHSGYSQSSHSEHKIEDEVEAMRPRSAAEARREASWRRRRKERSSLVLPPAEAPVFTEMRPPQRKKVDLDAGVCVTPSLAGVGGDALPDLVRATKQDERRKRAERSLVPGEDDDEPIPCCQKLNPFRHPRNFLFVLTCVYVFWYAGAFFGYGPMQLMLERQGAFSSLCDDADLPDDDQVANTGTGTTTTTCPEQNAMLLNVQFVAQLTMMASPLLGAWCDKNGPAEVVGGLFVSGALGILLLAIATSNLSIDWLLFPSFLCSGLMAQIAGLMTVQTGLIFDRPRTRNRVISALNALYDAGAITYLILWYIDTNTVLTLPTISALNLALFVVVVGSAIMGWYKITGTNVAEHSSQRLSSQDNNNNVEGWDDNEECKEEINDDITHTSLAVDFSGVDSDVVAPNGPSADDSSKKPIPRQKKISWRDGFEDYLSDDDDKERGANDVADKTTSKPKSALDIAKASASDRGGNDKNDENGASTTRRKLSLSERASSIIRLSLSRNGQKSKLKTSITFGRVDYDAECINEAAADPSGPRPYVLIASRPALDQLRSSQFLTLAAFFAFHHSRNTWTLTTMRDFLAYLGDDDTGNKYLAIFTLLTPASVLGLPFVDKIVHKGGYSAGLHVVNALAFLQGIIQVSSENLNVQVIGFVFYSFYRCFLFSVCFSCLPAFLDGIVLGKGYGLLIFGGGVLSLMNIPLSNAAVQKLGGNFFVPNLIYTILCAPCIILVWLIHRGFKREAEEKDRLKQAKSDEIQRQFGDVINVSGGSEEEEEVGEEKTTD